MPCAVSELEEISEELDGSATSLELDNFSLLEDFASEELEATLLLDFGSVLPLPVTVIVPLLDAFLEAPVVVTVNLYAPGATVEATVPEM